MPRPDSFTATQAARMTGVSAPTLIRHIESGLLKAARVSRGPKRNAYSIHRSNLVAFLLGIQYPLDRLRRLLNPGGKLVLCQTPTAFQSAAQQYTPTLYVDSLLDLGRAVETEPAWACVIHLPEVGTAEAVRSLRNLYGEGDRPQIVALAGEDGVNAPSPIPFDTILPAAWPVASLVKSVLTLRRDPG